MDTFVKKPDPVDIFVGARVRARRKMLSMSQTELGKQLGVTFQQVQKYERGANRIGSSRLYHMSTALDVPVAFFFEGAETVLPGYNPASGDINNDVYEMPETKELIEAYYDIMDPRIRKKVIGITLILSANNDDYMI